MGRRLVEVDSASEYSLVLVSDSFDFQSGRGQVPVVYLEIRSISEASAHGPMNGFVQISAGSGVQTVKERKREKKQSF